MDTILEMSRTALETLLKAPTILLFALALVVIGWALKRLALFPNRFIPLVVLGLSSAGMPFILAKTPPGDISPYMSNPDVADLVRRVCVGLIVGLVAWGAHRAVLGKLEKYLPGLSNGDTTTIPKPPTP